VVEDRNVYLKTVELDKTSLTCEGTPKLEEGEKPLIRVVHDESTYYANSDQSLFWGDDETNVLKQKSLGQSIMVSDIVDEVSGFLRDGDEMAPVMLEIQRDGYFNNNHLMCQVERAVDIFERVHPQACGILIFDNAPMYRKVAEDALCVEKNNVGSGGKQPLMRDTMFNGQVQRIVDSNGIPEGMKLVLQERGGEEWMLLD